MSKPGNPYLSYKVVVWNQNTSPDSDLQDTLNRYARVGWRLHTIDIHTDGRFARIVLEAEVTPE